MTEREKIIQQVESGETQVRELIKTFLKMSIDLYMDMAAKSDEELNEEFLKTMKNNTEA